MGEQYVITAAHCVIGRSKEDFKVRIGDTIYGHDLEAESFTVGVENIIQHPGYNTQNNANDIAIMKLDSKISLTKFAHIKPACLPSAGEVFLGEAIVSGWGTVASGSYLSSHLKDVGVTVFADGDCGSMNSVMTEDMICAGMKEGGKDSCQGDSGGPLVAADPERNNAMSLIGVVSFGYGCGGVDALGIYSEVSHFTHWLHSNMSDLNTCPPPPGDWNSVTTSIGIYIILII